MLQKFADAIEPCVASRTGRGCLLKTMAAPCERMEFTLYAHTAELLPRLYGVHRRPSIRIAMDEEDRACVKIERELGHQPGVIFVAAIRVRPQASRHGAGNLSLP